MLLSWPLAVMASCGDHRGEECGVWTNACIAPSCYAEAASAFRIVPTTGFGPPKVVTSETRSVNKWRVRTLGVYTTSDCTGLAIAGTAISSGTDATSTGTADLVLDGDEATLWTATCTGSKWGTTCGDKDWVGFEVSGASVVGACVKVSQCQSDYHVGGCSPALKLQERIGAHWRDVVSWDAEWNNAVMTIQFGGNRLSAPPSPPPTPPNLPPTPMAPPPMAPTAVSMGALVGIIAGGEEC